ncbi:MAG: hypothetical protein FWG99_01630 [Treponema sp.]|nr:hypothetical protein [Treponema sp.]
MNIGAVPYHTFPSIGYAISAAASGRMSLPVSPSNYIYSHFKHVSGVPAPDGIQGVNISKLKILDTLIEQLVRMKKQPSRYEGEQAASEERRADALIEQYQRQIQAAAAATPSFTIAPVSGALFNIAA